MFLTDLWIQKTKLRILNILMNYTSPKVEEIVGKEGAKTYRESFRKILVEGSEFPDGSTGTLEIQFVKNKENLPSRSELDIEEEKMRLQGKKYEKMALTSTYLDEYEYDVQVISESLFQKDSAEAQAVVQEKIITMAKFFPQIFMANQDILFEDFADAYGEDPGRYNLMPQMPTLPKEEVKATPEKKKAEAALPPLPPA